MTEVHTQVLYPRGKAFVEPEVSPPFHSDLEEGGRGEEGGKEGGRRERGREGEREGERGRERKRQDEEQMMERKQCSGKKDEKNNPWNAICNSPDCQTIDGQAHDLLIAQ